MGQFVVVFGVQWGDEGKGKIVDLFIEEIGVVVCFQGGYNVGYILVINGKKIVLYLILLGILCVDVLCLIGNGVVILLVVLQKEIVELEIFGVEVCLCLKIFLVVLLIMLYYIVLDQVCECVVGGKVIGIIGCGIGLVYEDKVVCCGICIVDLYYFKQFEEFLCIVLDYYNFVLIKYFNIDVIDFQKIYDEVLVFGEYVELMKFDVVGILYDLCKQGKCVLFEGVQGVLLDIDYGIYLYVISFNIIVGGVFVGVGVGVDVIDYVLGIVKVYVICVGGGLFLIELDDEIGQGICDCGVEYGVLIGCLCCCGWMDIVVFKCVVVINGISGLCIIKFDVFDGMEKLKVCIVYEYCGKCIEYVLLDVQGWEECILVYLEFLGWIENIYGIINWDDLLSVVCVYLCVLEELVGCLISIVFIGLDCDYMMVLQDLFV